jgi:transcriptional regulator with XRE-family HTH domain
VRPAQAASIYKQTGEAIARMRRRRKPRLTQQELANAAGISRASIANIERGRHRIQLHVLYDLAEALEVAPRDLLPDLRERAPRKSLPEDISRKLKTPREALAVSRLLESGRENGNEGS